jgi:MFS family permease
MQNRWGVLALLFAVRTTMAVQFQSVAAMSPVIMREFGIGLADIGLLIGLYLAPGMIIALPGGEIGRRFGDKQVVLFGLALMIGGGAMIALLPEWRWQVTGRLISGTGGVLLNVLMSKMVTDWFAGKEIATAMGIFVNSWPIGIAFALFVLPWVAVSWGLAESYLFVLLMVLVASVLLALLYRPPPVDAVAPVSGTWPAGAALRAVIVAGGIWGLYNAALGMIFGFGTSLLVEKGWTAAAAGYVTSLALWLIAVSAPAGGFIADRSGRHNFVMIGGFVVLAALLVVAARTEYAIVAFAALGMGGLSAGPTMSLPARVLEPGTRATGMGLFFSVFYVAVVAAPIVAGWIATAVGTSRAAFDFGAAMLMLCCAAYWLFWRLNERVRARTRMDLAITPRSSPP